MSWIREEDLKAIRQQADIVDIMSHYLSLTKKGKNYTALCPFHDDHDPSLSISQDKQIFKCFVCGAGGNVFTFVQRMEQISFPESVYKIADLIHYPLSLPEQVYQKKADPNEPLYKILSSYIQFLQYELNSAQGAIALDYLQKRKINEDIIQRFQFGYAPDGALSVNFLKAKIIDDLQQEQTGLAINGRAVFSDRIMIPIHDAHGNPVGFTARRLNDASEAPKYINTSQTVLYEKGNIVFNYHRALPFARRNHRCILVEGAMDVIAFEKADIHESVACLGTACTDNQLALIRRMQVPVIICYDGDRAGQDATYKFGKRAIASRMDIQVVKNTSGKDPDEIFDAGGKEELAHFVERTISFVEFLFDYLLTKYNLENYEDKKAYAQELFTVIDVTCDTFEKTAFISRIKTMTGFDFSSLAVKQPEKTDRQKIPQPVYVQLPESGRYRAERAVLSMILISKSAAELFRNQIGFFKDERCQQLSLYCYDIYRHADTLDMDLLMAQIDEEEIRTFLMGIWNDPQRIQTFHPDYFQDSIQKIKECTIQDQIDGINRKIVEVADPIEKAKLSQKKNTLIIEKKNIWRKEV